MYISSIIKFITSFKMRSAIKLEEYSEGERKISGYCLLLKVQ